MVLDEPRESDEVFQINGFTMVMDKELHKLTQDVTVDYVNYTMGSGFNITSQSPVGSGGCSSTSCSC